MTDAAKLAQKLILVVDDSATVRYAVCAILQRIGFRVAEAEDGDCALKLMKEETPDLVILDIHMPVKDGIQTLQEIRAEPASRDLPVFILTTSTNYVKKVAEHGISGYLVKAELNPTDLSDRIGTVLGKVAARPKKLQKSLGLKVLLAHGHSGDQRAIIGILADWGCTVMPTDNAAEAAELATGDPADLVLIEDRLADMDGFEAARALRYQGQKIGKRVPFILMTERPIDEVRKLGADAGMDAYVSKPVDPDSLFRTLQEIKALDVGDEGKGVSLFDKAELMERAGDEIELAQRMLELFFRDTPGLLKATQAAISAADSQIASDSAHTLKGMLGTLAAHGIAATAERLEDAGRDSQFETARNELAVLQGEIERLSEALKAEFDPT